MRIVVSHEGFVRGQPPRYRKAGELPVLMETAVDLETLDKQDVPLAYVLEDESGAVVREYRFHDGVFLTPIANADGISARASEGPVPLSDFGNDYFWHPYRELCEWRVYASRALRSKGELVEARVLSEWKAKDVDDSDIPVFRDALREAMKSLVVIDGRLWGRCCEPCLSVTWVDTQHGTEVRVRKHDTRKLFGYVEEPGAEDAVPRQIRPTVYAESGWHDRMHQRCFSVAESDRIVEFVQQVKAQSRRVMLHVDSKTSLRAVEPQFCSSSFDELELGRSARTYIDAWKSMKEIVIARFPKRWNDHGRLQEIDAQAADVASKLRRLEAGEASPEVLIASMERFRTSIDRLARSSHKYMQIDVFAFVPPEYFGDPDHMVLKLDVTLPAALRGP